MSDTVIRVENLGKRYRIGLRQPYLSLRDVITEAVKTPFRAFARRGQNKQDTDSFIWALKDVSFEVNRGDVLGIIGKNGAGKSTLLKILTQITEPTKGHATIHGRVASLLEVGTGFHPELTGRDNIFLNGAILGMSRKEIQRNFDEIVAFSEIDKFIDTPVKRYSSGMYVRLAFAVAAHMEPEILLVDEVLAVGDAEFQKKCLGKMGAVAKEGRTVLFVSHNMFSLQNLCTRGILLESGQVAMNGSVADVIRKYLDTGKKQNGEVCWESPNIAPGDDRVRLKAVRVTSEDGITGDVDISKEFRIEVDYWNLEPNRRRMVSIHLYNSMGICVLTSGNSLSVPLAPDPWYTRLYPVGCFRTSCIIPKDFLNDGLHSISVYINVSVGRDNILIAKDVLTFALQDTGAMREEYTGEWLGAVRPRLDWQTAQLSDRADGFT